MHSNKGNGNFRVPMSNVLRNGTSFVILVVVTLCLIDDVGILFALGIGAIAAVSSHVISFLYFSRKHIKNE